MPSTFSTRAVALIAVFVTSFALLAASAAADFGVESFEATLTNRDGSPDVLAGSHPYEFDTKIAFNFVESEFGPVPDGGNAKNIQVELPPGLIGNPGATPKCALSELVRIERCDASTQIGTLTLRLQGLNGYGVYGPFPVYNLTPPGGVAAQFGFTIFGVTSFIDSRVRTGGDYGITAELKNVPALLPIFESRLTLWGVPADPDHNSERECPGGGFGCASSAHAAPLFTNPTSCSGVPST
ncbi:MAG TPA: hypothetical protein VID29_10165, partial [Solirubrobacteraceae bacterium]